MYQFFLGSQDYAEIVGCQAPAVLLGNNAVTLLDESKVWVIHGFPSKVAKVQNYRLR